MQRSFLLVAFLCATAFAARAEIYRCTAASGAITYQEIPCPSSASRTATVDIPAAFPEVNRMERDRLLARADALEERLVKRAQIEAAERMAREERLARERELLAVREAQAQRAAEAAFPAVIVALPLPPRRHFPRRPLYRF